MGALKYIFFGIGTLAFFANVYLAIKYPKLVESPGAAADPAPDAGQESPADSELQQWDQRITWLMWGGWGLAALLGFLTKVGFFETPE